MVGVPIPFHGDDQDPLCAGTALDVSRHLAQVPSKPLIPEDSSALSATGDFIH